MECQLYTILYMQQVLVSAKAVIDRDGKILILKQIRPEMSYWDLPGGKIEFGEYPEETVVREVKEEVNVEVHIERLLGTWWFISPVNKYQVVCITYLCSANTFAIDLTQNPAQEDIQEYKWVTKEELLSGSYPFLHESIKDVVAKLE